MRLALLIVAAVQFGACASAPLTPQQEYVYRALETCRQQTGGELRVLNVEPDGRVRFEFHTELEGQVVECLRAQGLSVPR